MQVGDCFTKCSKGEGGIVVGVGGLKTSHRNENLQDCPKLS